MPQTRPLTDELLGIPALVVVPALSGNTIADLLPRLANILNATNGSPS